MHALEPSDPAATDPTWPTRDALFRRAPIVVALPDPCGGEIERERRAKSAGPDQQRAGTAQSLLPLDADLGQGQMASVARDLSRIER